MASRALDPGQPLESRNELGNRRPDQPIAQDAVASRAYELWEARGCPIGSPEIDWFQAEQELRSRTGNQKRTPDSMEGSTVRDSTASVRATEEQVNMPKTVPERVDKHGSKVEDAAGTGQHDSLGG